MKDSTKGATPTRTDRLGKASVLFSDVKMFTNIMEIFGPKQVEIILNELFAALKTTVEKNSGQVDKLIGDALMAVFWDKESSSCEYNALECAREILKNDLPEINKKLDMDLEVRIGISTGNVLDVDVAGVDKTVIGRSVNRAARLQSECKQFGFTILVDESTYQGASAMKQKYGFRLIPEQQIRGTYDKMNLYEVTFDRFDEEYLENFNKAGRDYQTGDYSAALNFFIKAFTDPSKAGDREILHYFISNCFEKLDHRKELFRRPTLYDKHSKIQRVQADFLTFLMKTWTKRCDIEPKLMLDLGCGTGAITKDVAKDYFPGAKVVGIDISGSQIENARQNLTKDYNVEFIKAEIERFDYPDKFDLVFSNSTMHWVEDQELAYRNIHKLLKENGLLVVHQGHKGCYEELRDAAEDALRELGFSGKFGDFVYPLRYHTRESIRNLLEKTGFEVLDIKVTESGATETLADDFAEAGLLPYRERLSPIEDKVFVAKYKEKASALTHINTTRLYFIAKKRGSSEAV
jgi:class 3 adenylate cyclase/SAM-dependent methyltransferase